MRRIPDTLGSMTDSGSAPLVDLDAPKDRIVPCSAHHQIPKVTLYVYLSLPYKVPASMFKVYRAGLGL